VISATRRFELFSAIISPMPHHGTGRRADRSANHQGFAGALAVKAPHISRSPYHSGAAGV
jgi:hypothetical protein